MAKAGEDGGGNPAMLRPNWSGLEHQWAKGNSGVVVVGFGMHQGGLATVIVGGALVGLGADDVAAGTR